MEIKLSIFIPLYNEAAYIEQCIVSLQSNHSAEFEVILSDNHSNDGTYENLQSINDSRFKIVRPPRKLSPQKHHWFAFNHCIGEYVFFIGGDDYFEDGIIDRILPNLQDEKIYIGQMRCFSDGNGSTIGISNIKETLMKKIFFNENFIYNYLNQISHDEIMYAFIPRKLLKHAHRIIGNCFETLLPWMGFLVFTHKNIIKNMKYIDEIVFNKRYNKIHKLGGFATDAYGGFWTSSYILKSIGSLVNCLIFFMYTLDLIGFLKLLFKNRSMERPITHKGGFLGQGKYGQRRWYLGPIFMLLLAPVLDISRILKNIFKTVFRMT